MEKWSVPEDERRYIAPARGFNPWLAAAAFGLIAWIAAFGYRWWLGEQSLPPAPAAAPTPASTEAAAPAPEPAIRHPVQVPQEAAESLPALDKSDAMANRALSGLIGNKAFERMVVPDQLVRRIVATVDNLPRRTAPTRVMPLNPVPGAFATLGGDEHMTIDAANYDRYAPYVRVTELVEPHALVYAYTRAYPLFQKAYEDLGYPGRYFNDRLVEAIDDLLGAPEIEAPRLLRAKVLYELADPDLETRSAGQKIMIRMGRDNATRVKAKLWEIRRELIAASRPPARNSGTEP